MNTEYLLILTVLFSILIFMIQRAEAKRRIIMGLLMIIPTILIRNFAVYRDVKQEAWIALIIAVFLNFGFWVLIGRYNPVGSSDSIKVFGMDD